jgi:magnesium-transporting ATPase (P-type)
MVSTSVSTAPQQDAGSRSQRPSWHALTAEQVEVELRASAGGLAPDEVAARQGVHGPNAIEEDGGPGRLRLFLHQFASPLIYLLLVAVGITLILGEWVDAAVIGFVLLLNAVIGFGQEYRAERSVRALAELAAPEARVVRGGEERVIDARELVPGDVVLLESGALVPADLRLIGATSLEIDESLLTGESRPVRKGTEPVAPEVVAADRTCLAYLGATVLRGRGRGYVVATGARTELGRVAERVRGERTSRTPLQQRMDRFANLLAVAVAVAAVAAFAIGLLRGESVTEMFLVAVALAVAVVPEGLPVVFTVALALGVRRMADHRAIVRRLAAVETLGSTSTIGSDKTGTLTENRMTPRSRSCASTRPSPACSRTPSVARPSCSPTSATGSTSSRACSSTSRPSTVRRSTGSLVDPGPPRPPSRIRSVSDPDRPHRAAVVTRREHRESPDVDQCRHVRPRGRRPGRRGAHGHPSGRP